MKQGASVNSADFAKDAQQIVTNYLSPENDTKGLEISDELRSSLTSMIEANVPAEEILGKLMDAQDQVR